MTSEAPISSLTDMPSPQSVFKRNKCSAVVRTGDNTQARYQTELFDETPSLSGLSGIVLGEFTVTMMDDAGRVVNYEQTVRALPTSAAAGADTAPLMASRRCSLVEHQGLTIVPFSSVT